MSVVIKKICSCCKQVDSGPEFYCPGSNRTRMERDCLCFTCAFWSLLCDKKDDKKIVRTEGDHYYIGTNNAVGPRGFGGREFLIKFNDGREVTTTCLWPQGTIPEFYRDRLPDNAIFIKKEETLPRGRYKGMSLKDIPSGYLKWVSDCYLDGDFAVRAAEEYSWRTKHNKHWYSEYCLRPECPTEEVWKDLFPELGPALISKYTDSKKRKEE